MTTKHLCRKLHALVTGHEDWLMGSILHYAIEHGYAAYTSTLVEPWRLSICGLSGPLLEALARNQDNLELNPDEDYSQDAIATFGILEAKRHRRRGISIAMFMGLFKYYRQVYLDLLDKGDFSLEEKSWCGTYLHRFFDRIELGLCSEWVSGSDAGRIAELQAANRQMTNEKNKYLTLFESLSQPVILLSATGILDRINQAAAEWLHVTDNRYYSIASDIDETNLSLQGKRYDELFPWLQGILEMLSQERQVIVEHRSIVQESKQLEIDVLCSAMCDISRKFSGYVLVFSDHTREYHLIAKLEDMQVKLETSNRRLEQFADSASHDLREPLRMVSSYVDLLALRYKGKLDAKADTFIEYARDGAIRMQAMIDSLLNLSHVQTSGEPLRKVAMERVVQAVLASLQARVREKGADIVVEPLPEVWADETQMMMLMQNLIANAMKFQKDFPIRIRIFSRQDEGMWVVGVEDNGIGIAAEDREHIFQAFKRLHTREEYEGMGLGLAICQAIVERHQGRIWVEPALKQGSVFCFSLPRRSADFGNRSISFPNQDANVKASEQRQDSTDTSGEQPHSVVVNEA